MRSAQNVLKSRAVGTAAVDDDDDDEKYNNSNITLVRARGWGWVGTYIHASEILNLNS